jgi:hypothetical protein
MDSGTVLPVNERNQRMKYPVFNQARHTDYTEEDLMIPQTLYLQASITIQSVCLRNTNPVPAWHSIPEK